MKKICTKCKKNKNLEEFSRNKGRKDGRNVWCKVCLNAAIKPLTKIWSQTPKGKQSALKTDLKRRGYGISAEEYNQMLIDQNNVCLICNQTCRKGRLAVDHCHKTGKVRGLLCRDCNDGIARFKENKEILESAIKYVEEKCKIT